MSVESLSESQSGADTELSRRLRARFHSIGRSDPFIFPFLTSLPERWSLHALTNVRPLAHTSSPCSGTIEFQRKCTIYHTQVDSSL